MARAAADPMVREHIDWALAQAGLKAESAQDKRAVLVAARGLERKTVDGARA